MQLNVDCVRDVLLCVEENTGLHETCVFVDENYLSDDEELQPYQEWLRNQYDNDTLISHVNYCIEAGLISEAFQVVGAGIYIDGLTPAGHEFLANIRQSKVWKIIKEKGISSLPAVIQFAADISSKFTV